MSFDLNNPRQLALYELRSIAQIHLVLLARASGLLLTAVDDESVALRNSMFGVDDRLWVALSLVLSLVGIVSWMALRKRALEISLVASAALVFVFSVGFGLERYYTPSFVYGALGIWLFVEWILPKPRRIKA